MKGMFAARAWGVGIGTLSMLISACASEPPVSTVDLISRSPLANVVVQMSMRGPDGQMTNRTMMVPATWQRGGRSKLSSDSVMFEGQVVHASDVVVRRSGDTSRVFIRGQLATVTTTESLRKHVTVYHAGVVAAEVTFTRSTTDGAWGFGENGIGANETESNCWWLAIQLAAAITAMVVGCGTLDPLICVPASLAYIGLQGQYNDECGGGALRQTAFLLPYKQSLFLGATS